MRRLRLPVCLRCLRSFVFFHLGLPLDLSFERFIFRGTGLQLFSHLTSLSFGPARWDWTRRRSLGSQDFHKGSNDHQACLNSDHQACLTDFFQPQSSNSRASRPLLYMGRHYGSGHMQIYCGGPPGLNPSSSTSVTLEQRATRPCQVTAYGYPAMLSLDTADVDLCKPSTCHLGGPSKIIRATLKLEEGAPALCSFSGGL